MCRCCRICSLPRSLPPNGENNLTQIAKGAADAGDFMQRIEAMARELVKENATADKDKVAFTGGEEKPSIGKCPRCGSPVHEGRKNFYCSNRDCAFTMWKNDRFFEERKVTFYPEDCRRPLKIRQDKCQGLVFPENRQNLRRNRCFSRYGREVRQLQDRDTEEKISFVASIGKEYPFP